MWSVEKHGQMRADVEDQQLEGRRQGPVWFEKLRSLTGRLWRYKREKGWMEKKFSAIVTILAAAPTFHLMCHFGVHPIPADGKRRRRRLAKTLMTPSRPGWAQEALMMVNGNVDEDEDEDGNHDHMMMVN